MTHIVCDICGTGIAHHLENHWWSECATKIMRTCCKCNQKEYPRENGEHLACKKDTTLPQNGN